jgi:hypothetical protein
MPHWFAIQFGKFCSELWKATVAFADSPSVAGIIVKWEIFPPKNILVPQRRLILGEVAVAHVHDGQSKQAPTLDRVDRGQRN